MLPEADKFKTLSQAAGENQTWSAQNDLVQQQVQHRYLQLKQSHPSVPTAAYSIDSKLGLALEIVGKREVFLLPSGNGKV